MRVIIVACGREFAMEVGFQEPVLAIKRQAEQLLGIPVERQTLSVCDWELVDGLDMEDYPIVTHGVELADDFRNLNEYGISEFSEISVVLRTTNRLKEDPPTRGLNIVVQMSSSLLNAATIPLEMKDSSTVNDLRQLLLSRKILPGDDYLFIHKQRIMRDNCSLRWHGVENGDCLYVFKGTVSRDGY
ncbi:Ubiquitin-like domain - like 4 [Theobroma cacao]|nr:Ubiquitin-like domain - like 4 [Theobroma cacao]